jgi:hypothetical protein
MHNQGFTNQIVFGSHPFIFYIDNLCGSPKKFQKNSQKKKKKPNQKVGTKSQNTGAWNIPRWNRPYQVHSNQDPVWVWLVPILASR